MGLHRSGPDREVLVLALELGVRAVDTAYNYRGGASHRLLRQRAGDLLERLEISTKVGFFPSPDGTVTHSLQPARLECAVRESATTLGVTPELVFLHNPERSLAALPPAQAADRLIAACAALQDTAAAGWCRRWGISSWSPTALLPALDALPADVRLGPAVLMVRAGLSVTTGELDAGEQLAGRLDLARHSVWGMAPFGGDPDHPVWTTSTTTALMCLGQPCSPIQAAYRLAFEIPPVARVAVGASSPAQLRALLAATELRVDPERIARYRHLLRQRVLHRVSASSNLPASRRAGSNNTPA